MGIPSSRIKPKLALRKKAFCPYCDSEKTPTVIPLRKGERSKYVHYECKSCGERFWGRDAKYKYYKVK
jgi:transcription elongation factor Elf1